MVLPLYSMDEENKGHRIYRMIDLFAGIGGMRIAFESSNQCYCVFTSEWDKQCQKTYLANWPNTDIKGDIRNVDPRTIPDFDILCAGFPCQPFSSVGKREGFEHKAQGSLFFNIAKIIYEKRPKAFLLENVPGILNHDKGNTLRVICDVLRRDLDYEMDYKILDAADFGLPQFRKRVFFVGFRKDLGIAVRGVDFRKDNLKSQGKSTKINFDFPLGSFRNKHVGFGRYVETNALGPSVSIHLQTNYLFKIDDGKPQVVDKNTLFPVKTLCASYYKIQRLTGTFVRGGETGIRLFTESECKAIQGFPSDFKVPVSRTSMYRQFGNAVAVPVVREVAQRMIHCLDLVSLKDCEIKDN
jgi:DNA (cytosine-5)-methyltransferase 1